MENRIRDQDQGVLITTGVSLFLGHFREQN